VGGPLTESSKGKDRQIRHLEEHKGMGIEELIDISAQILFRAV